MKTEIHKKAIKAAKNTPLMSTFAKPKSTPMQEKVATAEIKSAAFFAEHNISFAVADHFTDFCKSAFTDSNICKDMSVKRTKMSYLIQDGIAHYEHKDLISILKEQKFSLVIDESTDISVTQVLAIVVRYFDFVKCDVIDAFLDSIIVEDGSAQGLYMCH